VAGTGVRSLALRSLASASLNLRSILAASQHAHLIAIGGIGSERRGIVQAIAAASPSRIAKTCRLRHTKVLGCVKRGRSASGLDRPISSPNYIVFLRGFPKC
jgi:hypothetical protein